jgi:hypothetical protein
MPYKLPLHVERTHSHGKSYLYFRVRSKGGPRIRLPDDPRSSARSRTWLIVSPLALLKVRPNIRAAD